jgi:hypothetical protein
VTPGAKHLDIGLIEADATRWERIPTRGVAVCVQDRLQRGKQLMRTRCEVVPYEWVALQVVELVLARRFVEDELVALPNDGLPRRVLVPPLSRSEVDLREREVLGSGDRDRSR